MNVRGLVGRYVARERVLCPVAVTLRTVVSAVVAFGRFAGRWGVLPFFAGRSIFVGLASQLQ